MALKEEFEMQGNWLFKHRSYIPLLVLSVGFFIYFKKEYNAAPFYFEPYFSQNFYEVFCLLVSLFGLLIRVFTIGYTPENTSGRNTDVGQKADTVNKRGIYSMVRHPLYLGNFFMWLGPALLTVNFWFVVSFCMFYWVYYERIMFAEEQFLRKKFEDEYLKWSNDVPAFIPNMKDYKRPNLNFSWKKVLKQEKNGVFALFLIFSCMNIGGQLLKGENNFNYAFISMTIVSAMFYVSIKILKKKTRLLDEKGR